MFRSPGDLAKVYSSGNRGCGRNFRVKLCTCAQGIALGTRARFRLGILIRSVISAINRFLFCFFGGGGGGGGWGVGGVGGWGGFRGLTGRWWNGPNHVVSDKWTFSFLAENADRRQRI